VPAAFAPIPNKTTAIAVVLFALSAKFVPSAALAQPSAMPYLLPPAENEPPLQLRAEPALSERNAVNRTGRPLYGRAERITGRADREATLLGDAELRTAGSVINADRITYYADDDQVIAVGEARVVRDGNVFVGPELTLRLDTYEGFFSSPRFSLPRYNGKGNAERIDFKGKDHLILYNSDYTTCDVNNPDWLLRSRELDLNEVTQEGTGTDVEMIFKGRKVCTLAKMGFPLSNKRRTGFLPPTAAIAGSNSGILLPYYWNIAPNRDLTLLPNLLIRHGLQLGADFRYLEPTWFGRLEGEWLANDRNPTSLAGANVLDPGVSRYRYSWDNTFSNIGGWSGRAQVRRVSDDTYFVDFGRTIINTAERSLPADLTVRRTFGDWNASIQATKFQNILEARTQTTITPYDRLPQVQLISDRRDFQGFDWLTRFEATRFDRDVPLTPNGWRVVGNTSLAYPFVQPAFFFTPKISLNATQYSLDYNAGNPESITRVLPTVSFDTGTVFERPTTLWGAAYTQTLEPRLYYVRTPYRDQSLIPVFDTQEATFNFGQLFAENTFVGGDRIADVNQLTTAAVTRFIDSGSGQEKYRLAVGQRLYFSEQRVTLPTTAPRIDQRSDLLLAGTAMFGARSYIDGGVQYSIERATAPRYNITWRHWPDANHLLNLSYRYQQGEIEQIDTSWQTPLSRRWATVGRVNWSLLTQQQASPALLATQPVVKPGPIETMLGVAYNADCWVFRVVGTRFIAADGKARLNVFFQFELSGLGGVGSDLFDILRRNVPGYRYVNDRPQVPSSYFGYE
jgi:LPS-assembly protein